MCSNYSIARLVKSKAMSVKTREKWLNVLWKKVLVTFPERVSYKLCLVLRLYSCLATVSEKRSAVVVIENQQKINLTSSFRRCVSC